jgi:glycosyltransferase involved in cell wall biosynthesis
VATLVGARPTPYDWSRVSDPAAADIELSVVIPCLDEANSVGICIDAARRGIASTGLSGEVIVADNGSSDDSPEIARRHGATVVTVERRGYGSALRGGIEAAHGDFIVMGDADASYDLASIAPFVAALTQGGDLVIGNRFKGGIEKGAMPWLNRWIGNPVLSYIGRLFFRTSIGDLHCGLRAFTRDAYERMGLRTTGMEFATEMVAKGATCGLRIAEVPTTLRVDRRGRRPHLRPWRDGWRHLRFMLLYSPRWLFFVPGATLFAVGAVVGTILAIQPVHLGGVVLDIHTLLFMGVAVIVGFQLIVFAVVAKIFAVRTGLHPPEPRLWRLFRYVRLETGLLVGVILTLLGIVLGAIAFSQWGLHGFEQLNPRDTMRLVIPAAVLLALGVETVFVSFLLSALGIDVESALADNSSLTLRAERSPDGATLPPRLESSRRDHDAAAPARGLAKGSRS